MGLPPAHVKTMSVVLNLKRAGGCPAFLRARRTGPKKLGQFPPLRKFVLFNSNHVYGMNPSFSLFVMSCGNSPIFSYFKVRIAAGCRFYDPAIPCVQI